MIDPAPVAPDPLCVLLVRGAHGLYRAEQWLLAAGTARVVLVPLDETVSTATALSVAYLPPTERRPELPHLLVGDWTLADWQGAIESLEPGVRFVFDTHSAAFLAAAPSPQVLRQILTDRGVVGIPVCLQSTPLDWQAARQQIGPITSWEYRLADWKAPSLRADHDGRDHLGLAVWSALQDFVASGALPASSDLSSIQTIAHRWSGTSTLEASRFWGHATWQDRVEQRPIPLTIDLDFGSPVVDQRGWCLTGPHGQLRQGRLYRCSPAGEVIDEAWPTATQQQTQPAPSQPVGERLLQALAATPADINQAWSQLQTSWVIWQRWHRSEVISVTATA